MTTARLRRISGILACGATLGATAELARRGVPTWDSTAFRALNHPNDAVQYLAWAPMQAGALASPLATGAAVAVHGDRRKGATIAAAGAGAWIAAKLIKRLVGRDRPSSYEQVVRLRIGAAGKGLGFPSGHAAVSATIARTVPTSESPYLGSGLALLAAAVGVSRVYVGAHYPLDVLGGWALGVVLAETTKAVLSNR